MTESVLKPLILHHLLPRPAPPALASRHLDLLSPKTSRSCCFQERETKPLLSPLTPADPG